MLESAASRGAPDTLYATERDVGQFRFDAEVAEVFDDMITRSVPGYASLVHGIGVLAGQYTQANAYAYDLGCSLGATARSLRRHLPATCPVIAVDASADMIAACERRADPGIEYQCADIRKLTLRPARVIVLNLTLQFILPAQRLALIQQIAGALQEGGVLILAEKLRFEEPVDRRMLQQHEAFKRNRGYSELEISQKRAALEQVLVRDTLATHEQRLIAAKLHTPTIWFQCLNFVSLLAFR